MTSLVREAWASLRGSLVTTVLTILMVGSMCLILLLTIGRTEASSAQVARSFEALRYRTFVVRASQGAGVSSMVLARIQRLGTVSSVYGFGPSTDFHASGFMDADPVAWRLVYSADGPGALGHTTRAGTALASRSAVAKLHLFDGVGPVVSFDGESRSVVGVFTLPEALRSVLGPCLLTSSPPAPALTTSLIVVTVHHTAEVSATSGAVSQLLDAQDSSKVTIDTDDDAAAELASKISHHLGSFARSLILLLTVLVGGVLGAVLYGTVLLRRKDYGRRRALGASRSLIVELVLLQTAICTVVGMVVADAIALVVNAATHGKVPGFPVILAIHVLTAGVAVVAAVLPAHAASVRDPITELRVP